MRSTILTVSSAVLISCLAAGKPAVTKADPQAGPAWISGSTSAYPATQYLTGVGDSFGQERAKDKARADLVKVIQVKIDATSNLNERVSRSETNSGVRESIRQSTIDDINTSTNVELKSIQIADTWYDSEKEKYYALAILPRDKASKDILQEMQQLDEETSGHITRSNNSSDPFDKVVNMNKAVIAQMRNKALKGYLIAINNQAAAEHKGLYDADTLQAQMRVIQRQIPISVNVIGEHGSSLSIYARGGLSQAGYKPAKGNTQYVLDVELDKEPAIYRDKVYWVFANLEIGFRNALTNKTIGTCSWEFKEGSQAKSRASKKVLESVKEVFDTEFNKAFYAFINNTACR